MKFKVGDIVHAIPKDANSFIGEIVGLQENEEGYLVKMSDGNVIQYGLDLYHSLYISITVINEKKPRKVTIGELV